MERFFSWGSLDITDFIQRHQLLSSVLFLLVQGREFDILGRLGLIPVSTSSTSTLGADVEPYSRNKAHLKGPLIVSRSCVPIATSFLPRHKFWWSLS
jgi:hypothetical protein